LIGAFFIYYEMTRMGTRNSFKISLIGELTWT